MPPSCGIDGRDRRTDPGQRELWTSHGLPETTPLYDYAETVGKDWGRIEIRWGGVIGVIGVIYCYFIRERVDS